MNKRLVLMITVSLILGGVMLWAAPGRDAGDSVTIEIVQWWQPQMRAGSFDRVISDFEAKNSDIRVRSINLPFSEMLNQITIGNASGTLSDVIGVNPPWLSDFIKQGIVEPLDDYIVRDRFDESLLANKLVIDDKQWIFLITTFLYPLFYNLDHFQAAGLAGPPGNWNEFIDYARRLTVPARNQYGWVIPMALSLPNGAQHEVLSWAWSGGDRALRDNSPNLENPGVRAAVNHVFTLFNEGAILPGALTKTEQEKNEDFANGRVSMMISSIALINQIRERNPNLRFDIAMVPGPVGYTGRPGLSMAGWAIGMSRMGRNKEASWKLIKHFMDTEQNSFISSNANAFPGNRNSTPDFVSTDALFAKAFEMYQRSDLVNEFMGQPNAPGLQRALMEELHALFEGRQNIDATLRNAQAKWTEIYGR